MTAMMLLADGRFPGGGHAHSGGLEPAVAAGRVTDLADLEAFLRGRLATVGLVAAAFAAAACAGSPDQTSTLDAEFDARTPSPAQRRVSRAQGRALLRAARTMWALPPVVEAHHPVALGVVARAAGLAPGPAAGIAAYSSISGPASAAVRLLGLDPYAVHARIAALAPLCDATAARAAGWAGSPPEDLPAASAPMADISAEDHATWEVRLFAS